MSAAVDQAYSETIDLHQRKFQRISVDQNIYCVPVDKEEENRLETQHQAIQILFDDRLIFPRMRNPLTVLDCGYGRGSWATSMAETYSNSQVTAIDIYPATLTYQPTNLHCKVWDMNSPLTDSGFCKKNSYDIINSRFVSPGLNTNRWDHYTKELKSLCLKGGWVQLIEYHYIIQSDAGLLTNDHAIQKWGREYRHLMSSKGRHPRAALYLKDFLTNAGFVDVRHCTYQFPIGEWINDEKQKRIGRLNVENIGAMVESLTVWPFATGLRWTAEQVNMLVNKAREEILDSGLKLYIPLHVAWGRKP